MVPKFRAWDKEGKLYQDEEVSIVRGQFVKSSYAAAWWMKEAELFNVQQSTGLKDKNGVEIFEGDVLTSNVQPCKMVNPIKDGYGVVRFENGMFKLGAISLVTFISKMEVIGNIYENPELLEQAHEI
ncbi:YopX family protein [Enterococcus casseliflavus]